MKKKIDQFKQYVSYLKDVVYIISILLLVYKTILKKEAENNALKTSVDNNTETIKKLNDKFDKFFDSQIEIQRTQSELNGRFKNFIESSYYRDNH